MRTEQRSYQPDYWHVTVTISELEVFAATVTLIPVLSTYPAALIIIPPVLGSGSAWVLITCAATDVVLFAGRVPDGGMTVNQVDALVAVQFITLLPAWRVQGDMVQPALRVAVATGCEIVAAVNELVSIVGVGVVGGVGVTSFPPQPARMVPIHHAQATNHVLRASGSIQLFVRYRLGFAPSRNCH